MTRFGDLQMERKRLDLGSGCIYYETAGQGRPVVLVHGLSGSSRWWARNVGALGARFRVYVVDLIGFGASRCPDPQSGRPSRFALQEAVGYLASWMDALGLGRASFIGHSMGGLIVADLAARFPGRVERLVLVDAAGLPFAPVLARHGWNLARSLRYMPPGFLPILVADAWRAGPRTLWRAGREILSSDLSASLAEVRAPVLIVWGEHDALIPPATGQRLSQALPGSEFLLLPGAGHNAMWDRPAQFNRHVMAFLSGTGG